MSPSGEKIRAIATQTVTEFQKRPTVFPFGEPAKIAEVTYAQPAFLPDGTPVGTQVQVGRCDDGDELGYCDVLLGEKWLTVRVQSIILYPKTMHVSDALEVLGLDEENIIP